MFLFQHKGGVGAAGQPRCPRYPVEHVAVPLLADVVDDHHRQGVPVRKILEQRYVPVVVGIGVVLGRGAYLLQGVNDDKPGAGALLEIVLKLAHQPVRQLAARHGEAQALTGFIGQTEQPVLDAVKGVLQTQVQHVPRRGRQLPQGPALRHAQAQLQHEPAFADLLRPAEQGQASGNQAVHYEAGLVKRLIEQRVRVHGFQLLHDGTSPGVFS